MHEGEWSFVPQLKTERNKKTAGRETTPQVRVGVGIKIQEKAGLVITQWRST